MKNEEVVIHSSRGHILQIGKKFYKLYKEEKDKEGRTVERQIYKEIDKDKYLTDIKRLARRVGEEAPVKLVDIIFDALKDLPLERTAKIGASLFEAQNHPEIDMRRGGCVEIKIGNEHLVLRE